MAIRGKGTRHGRGRGRSDPPQPSQSCTSPPQPPHVSASPGVKKGSFDVLIKQQAADAHSTNPQLISMAIRGRGTKRGRGRGRSDPPQPSQSCTSPPPPPHASAGEDEGMRLIWEKINHFSSNPYLKMAIQNRIRHGRGRGLGDPPLASTSPSIKHDKSKIQKQGLVKGADALKNKQKITAYSSEENEEYCDYDDGEDEEIQLIWEKINHFNSNPLDFKMGIRGRGTRHGQGRGCSDSLSPGIKNDKNIMQKQGLVKGIDAIKDRQKITTFSSEENEEYCDYDDGEDEEMQLKQHTAAANNVKKGIGFSGVSNSEKISNATSDSVPHPVNNPTPLPSSGGSHVETDRRNVISVEAISNPRRFIPQSVTRDIVSTLIMRMPTPSEKWRNYSGEMKDELFKDFMAKYQFASDYDRSMARTVWERTCMDRYPDTLKNARKTALKQVKSTNLADTKGHGPKGMKVEVWDGLVDIWLKPEWKKQSDANRSNRAVLADSVLHTGGSISFREHKRKMEAELKHEISYRDVYDRVHRKKDGEYVSQRSKTFIESYDSIMLEKYGEDCSMHPVVDSKVWADVSGPNKKRAFGGHNFGNHGSIATSSSEVIGPSRTVAMTQADIKEAVNIAMTSFVQSQLMPMLEPILFHLQSMHDGD